MAKARAILLGMGFGLAIAVTMANAADYKVIHNFPAGNSDGSDPYSDLLFVHGDLYGTTAKGGSSANAGTVFKLSADGTETILHIFTGKSDGYYPYGVTLERSTGDIYGLAGGGGIVNDNCSSGCGVVYKLTSAGAFSVLHSFNYADGEIPVGRLVHDPMRNVYGVTVSGGTGNAGTIFKIMANGVFSVLYNFTNGNDGGGPEAGLARDNAANLYGTAFGGARGFGVVYKITLSGSYSVLHSFAGGNDGAYPFGGLALDLHGSLYGTTEKGGAADAGTIFKLAPDGTFTQLHSFSGTPDGQLPQARLIKIKDALYGTTFYGGSPRGQGYGTVFKIRENGAFTVLHTFDNTDGCSPYAGLTEGNHGLLYGATFACGTNGWGVAFSVKKK